MRSRRERAECLSPSIPAPTLRRTPRPSARLPLGLGEGPPFPAKSPLLTARRARVEPGELGARLGPQPRPLCTPALRPAPLFTASLCMLD